MEFSVRHYLDGHWRSAEKYKKYQNKHTLIVEALKVLEGIRYYQPTAILEIFFEYSSNGEESIAKQATHGLEALAGYDLDIFYGDGKEWQGLEWEPQEKVLEKINSFESTEKIKYFLGIIAACDKILSPTIEGTRWNYNSLDIRTGSIPAKDGIKNLRDNTLTILQELYQLADSLEKKKMVLGVMYSATEIPHRGTYRDDVRVMIIANAITVLEFMENIASSKTEDMQIMKQIEHDAYWLFYHMHVLDPEISRITLKIRDVLYAHKEYKIFRVLIGFKSIFHEWEKDKKEQDNFEQEEKFRESEVIRFALKINNDTYPEWKDRIIYYASIKSNDMATFPYFGKFLEHFSKSSPLLALQLLSEVSDELEGFLIAILNGISETEQKNKAYAFITNWCDHGKYLFSLARFFEFSSEVDAGLLKKILDKAKANDNLSTLNQIVASVSAQYKDTNKHLIKDFFIPSLKILTAHKNSDWIFGFWFRKQRSAILADMSVTELRVILDNLFWISKIDYHAEEILCEIAKHVNGIGIMGQCGRAKVGHLG